MAVLSLTDAYAYVAGYDFTTDTNNLAMTTDVTPLEKTTFGSGGWTESAGGLKSVNFGYSGFWGVDSGVNGQAPDNQAFPQLGTADQVYTVGPVETEGSPAYMFRAMKSQYTMGGQVGELLPFSLQANGTNGLGAVRGQLAKSRGTVAATGPLGSAVNLGAASATQRLYASFHAFSAGTTITVQVQSDDTSGFATPTTVATIGPLTASGASWSQDLGPVTDTWFRFNVSAITGSFIVAGAIGIQ